MIFGNSLSGGNWPLKSEQVRFIAKLAPHLQKIHAIITLKRDVFKDWKEISKKNSKPIQT